MTISTRPFAPGPRNWALSLDGPLVEVLKRGQVTPEAIDANTLRLPGVPMDGCFSKPRANLLLRRVSARAGAAAFIDADLAYAGDDAAIAAIFTGTCARNWRELRSPLIPGTAGEALSWLLSLLRSPLAAAMEAALARCSPSSQGGAARGGMLDFAGELLTSEAASAWYERSFRKSMARDLAVLLSRPAPPHCAVLWGENGAGASHLMMAAAWPLMENDSHACVYRVSAAMVGAGCIFPPERDAALMALLRDALALKNCVLLIEDLDVCLTGSPIGFSLLNGALDRGLRFLATFKSVEALRELRRDEEATARRLAAICVPSPSRTDVAKAVQRLAEDSGVAAPAETIQAAVGLTDRKDAVQPTAALAQLGAVIAEARWQGRQQIGPDDVLALYENQWPE